LIMTGDSITTGVSLASLVSGPAGTMTITTPGAATHIITADTTTPITMPTIAIYLHIEISRSA
jgi:hypothetical protein